MKDNKTPQGAATATGYGREVSAKEAARQKSQAHAYAYNTSVQPAYEAMQPIVRRYAIDDHGGGYQGL
jgi:hypothetical protein